MQFSSCLVPTGGLVAQAGWLHPKVSYHCTVLYSSHEPSELCQLLCDDESTINIVLLANYQTGAWLQVFNYCCCH